MPPRKKSGVQAAVTGRPKGTTARPSPIPLILVVDDLADNREMYAEYLEYSGYAVMTASDGQRAVDLATEHHPEVILMDISLPVIDGLEAARILKADSRTMDIVILVLTGHVEAQYRQRAADAGCDLFVAKPCLPADVVRHVETLLDRRKG